MQHQTCGTESRFERPVRRFRRVADNAPVVPDRDFPSGLFIPGTGWGRPAGRLTLSRRAPNNDAMRVSGPHPSGFAPSARRIPRPVDLVGRVK